MPLSSCVSNCISLSTSMSSTKSCLCCGGSHSLQKFYKFIGFSYEERVAFIKEHCFGCFNRGHKSKGCRFRLKCNVCQSSHSTLLHKPKNLHSNFKSSENVISNSVSSATSSTEKFCSVVPVWLSHASIPSCKKLVYALLDSQSDSSFILDKTLNSFNVSSRC